MSKLRFTRPSVCSLITGTEDDAAGILNVVSPMRRAQEAEGVSAEHRPGAATQLCG